MRNNIWIFSLFFLILNGCSLFSKPTPNQELNIETEEYKSEAPRSNDLPVYLEDVTPLPGSIHSLEDYDQMAKVPFFGGKKPGICILIWPSLFMERGDFYIAEEWIEDKVFLKLNDISLGKPNSLMFADTLGTEKYNPETGELEWKEPDGSPISACYAANLNVGIHTAELVVTTTSGKVTKYSWSFELTD